jgi:hypothetical protein
MCLDRLNSNIDPCESGYKVFFLQDGGLYGDWMSTHMKRPTDEWLNEKDFRPEVDKAMISTNQEGGLYKAGWHVFHNRRDAVSWACGDSVLAEDTEAHMARFGYCVRKVDVRTPTTTGIHFILGRFARAVPITVCEYILIHSEAGNGNE